MRKLTDACLCLTLLLFAVSFSVTATLSFRPLYYFDIDFLHIAEDTGYSKEVIRENYDRLIDYNLSWKDKELSFSSFSMSENGREHFREVRAIFQFFVRMLPVTAVFAAIGIFWKKKRGETGYLKAAAILILALLLTAGAMILAGWDRAFVLFHRLLFRNDYWLFDPAEDPVINILPDAFFLHCACLLLLLLLLIATLCWIAERKCAKLP